MSAVFIEFVLHRRKLQVYVWDVFLDDLLNIDNIYFDQMVDRIYPTELQLNRAIFSDTRHLFWIWIYVFLMVRFPSKSMINGTILILI